VLLAVCQECGIEVDRAIVPRIAFGFAGGMGNTGGVCGAVAGGVMAISLALPKTSSTDEALGSLALVAKFRQRRASTS
jgi:C_GCAxxG_C_C family probable redox protein